MEKIVVGMGEALWDIHNNERKIGGAPANFAYHVSQFGLPVCVVSAIGDDELGNGIIENFNSKRLDCLIEKVPYPTGIARVELDDAGVPQYEIRENAAWDNIPYTQELERLARRTKAVCFGSLAQRSTVSRDTIRRFLKAMPHDDETLVVFDANLRLDFYDKEVLHDSIKRCNVLKINDEELVIVGKMFGYEGSDIDICREILDEYRLKILILTCGTKGSFVFTPGYYSFRPTEKVTAIDTVGAGDSFTAAFISGILKGKTVAEAHASAVKTSAYVCTQKGAMPVLPEEYRS